MKNKIESDKEEQCAPVRVDRFNRPVQNVVEEIGITGCRFIGRNETLFKRALWVFLLIACTILTGYQMYKQIYQFYFAPNIATNLDLEIRNQLKFPAVTLCSSARTRLTAVVDILSEMGNGTNGLEILENSQHLQMDEPANIMLQNLAAQKDSFILQCKWWDGPCKDGDIVMTATNTGICYTINGAKNASRTTKRVGIEGSLTLLLNIESYETLNVENCARQETTNEQQTSGVMVKIHSQDEIPIFENSLLLPTGFTHDLKMVEVRKSLIDVNDGGTCSDQQNLTHYNASARSQHYISTCQMDRLLSMIESDCNCRPFLSPNESQSTLFECSVTQHFDCVLRFLFGNGVSNKTFYSCNDCMRGCETTEYKTMQSFSSLPDRVLDTEIGRMFQFNTDSEESTSCTTTLLSRNKTLRMRQDYLRATLLQWQSSYVDEAKEETVKATDALMHTFDVLLEQGFAPYHNTYLPAYERLQMKSQCFKTITTKYAGYLKHIDMSMDVYPNALEMTASPEMSQIITYFSGNFDPLSLASYLVQSMVQFKQLLQVYSRDNFADTKYKSEILEYVMQSLKHAEYGGTQAFAIYEEFMSSKEIQLLTTELDATLQIAVESDFLISVLNVLDKSSVTTQYALKFAESLNKGNKLGNDTLLGMFSHDPQKLGDIDDIRAFVSLLLDCSRNELPMVVSEILRDFNQAYGAFKQAYTAMLSTVAHVGRQFIWDDSFINDNLLQVRINFGDLQVENIKQQRTYTGWDLLCDVGGTLGLFLGASVLTLFEGLYLGYQYHSQKRANKC